MGSVKDEPQALFHGERTALTCAHARSAAARRLDRSYRAPAYNETMPTAGDRWNPVNKSGIGSEMIEKMQNRHAEGEQITSSVESDTIFVSDLSRRLGL